MKVVITGCSRVGSQLAEMLSLDGHEVVIIDRDSSSFKRLSKAFSGEVIEGFAFDEDTLNQAGVEDAQAFASVTNYDNTNLMTAEVVKNIFHVPKVVARMYNSDKEPTYQALGIDYVCGPEVTAQAFLDKIYKPLVLVRTVCGNNTLNIVEFNCPARWVGKKVQWAEEIIGLKVAFIARGGGAILRDRNERFQDRDEVTALISSRRLQRLERTLRRRGRG